MQRIRIEQPMADAIAVGRIWHYGEEVYTPSDRVVPADGRETERQRFTAAVAAVRQELERLAATEAIFAAHLELTEDPMLAECVEAKIADGATAADALHAASEELSELFAQIDDEYLRSRADDVRDICRRIRRALQGAEPAVIAVPAGCVLAAEELAPSDTAAIDFSQACGLVTRRGSATSHVAILARNRGIPAIVGLGDVFETLAEGETVVLDGTAGELVVAPTPELESAYRRRAEERLRADAACRIRAAEPAVTCDGRRILVAANVGDAEETRHAIACGADGIGLFRSELLYMQQQQAFPDEAAQAAAYIAAAKACGDRPLVIRTLDIGGDKALPYYEFPHEENPFLGWRAIRVSLELREVFRTQLRAILRASAAGNVRVMFPMIVSLEELHEARALLESCKKELAAEGVAFDETLPVGVMIETPAAVMMAEELAAEVDFFSVGTNDLTQYMLAVDRGNNHIAAMYDPLHPAVVRALRRVVEAAHRHGRGAGICGEFAAAPEHAELLAGLGFDELSVAAPAVAALKERIRRLDGEKARMFAGSICASATKTEVHALIDRCKSE